MPISDNTLEILIQLGVVGKEDAAAVKDLLNETGTAAKDMSAQMGVVTVSSADVDKALAKTGESAKESHVSHRALSAVFQALRQQSPELAEALHSLHMVEAFGSVGAVFALIKAWEIYTARINEAVEAMSGVKMPDLTSAITQANQLGIHWNGIAEAVTKANKEFDSFEKRNDRGKSDDEKDHDRRKKQLELQKEQALANLDLQKGAMSPAAYALNKSAIENNYLGKEAAEDERFEDQKLQRKEEYAKDLWTKAQRDAAAADKMKLPKSQEEFDAQQKGLEDAAKAREEDAKKADDRLGFIGQLGSGNVLQNQLDYKKFYDTYGYNASTSAAMAIEVENKKRAEEDSINNRKQIEQRQKQWEKKKEFQDQAGNEAGESATAFNELYSQGGDVDQFRSNSRFQRQTTQANQAVNTTKAVGEATQHGQDVKAALDALHQAHISSWKEVAAQLRIQARAIQMLGHQIGIAHENGR